MIETEVSFQKDVGPVDFGTKGSVRVDVIEYNPDGTVKAIYDLKTGSAKLTPERIKQIREAVGVSENVPVIEIRPVQSPTNTATQTTSAAAN